MICLETHDLHHHYASGHPILSGVDLCVPAGSIFGFLGPNGAGKTTTLRLLLGLTRRQRGRIAIFGRDLDSNRIAILRRVGALIECPSVYEHLDATENLQLQQRIHRVPASRIAEVLAQVGLADAGRKRVGQFSLGMKQRLGLASALLHRPALLILDEPTNGLDPNGILEMRDLLVRLNREEGTTILVSSHLLAEVERLVSHVAILHRGRLRFQGALAALKSRSAAVAPVALRTADDSAAMRLLAEAGIPVRRADHGLEMPPMPDADIAAANRRLVQHGVAVHAIGVAGGSLEAHFMDLIGSTAP
jgi:ABC-2 type transport system ATP-binding protein